MEITLLLSFAYFPLPICFITTMWMFLCPRSEMQSDQTDVFGNIIIFTFCRNFHWIEHNGFGTDIGVDKYCFFYLAVRSFVSFAILIVSLFVRFLDYGSDYDR